DAAPGFEDREPVDGEWPLLPGHPGGAQEVGLPHGFSPFREGGEQPIVEGGDVGRDVGLHPGELVSLCQRYSANTAAATTDVHRPSRSPIADWVTLRVITILVDRRQRSLRSS